MIFKRKRKGPQAQTQTQPQPQHATVLLGGVPIDVGIAPLIEALWESECKTLACCEGHPEKPKNPDLVATLERQAYILFDHMEDAFDFFYYIPEEGEASMFRGEGYGAAVYFHPECIANLVERWR